MKKERLDLINYRFNVFISEGNPVHFSTKDTGVPITNHFMDKLVVAKKINKIVDQIA